MILQLKLHSVSNTEWKDLLTNYNGTAITYDTIGNPLNWTNGKTFTWTAGRQLSGVTDANNTIAYTYDDNGIRTSKTVNGTKTDYYLNGTAIIMQKTGDQCIWYTYDESGNLSGLRVGNSEYYYYRNGQGDIIGIIDGTGSIAAKYSYDAWGTPIAITDGAGNDVSGNVSHIANINPFRYRGYFYDVETGLYYLQSRYYDPQVGRFINGDGVVDNRGITTQNLFSYCGNNPVNNLDSSGHFFGSVALFLTITAIALLTGCQSSNNVAPPTPVPSLLPTPSPTPSPAPSPSPEPTPAPTIPSGGVTVYRGTPRICTDGSSGDLVPDGDWAEYTAYSRWTDSEAKVLDAYEMPYIVIPKGSDLAELGDVAYLINHDNGMYVKCIVGDVGYAKNGWGEVSIAAIWDTGYPNHMTAKNASGITSNYEIIVFPGVSYNYDWSWGYRTIKLGAD